MMDSTQVSELITRGAKDVFYVGLGAAATGVMRGVTVSQRLVSEVTEAGQEVQERAEALLAKRSEGLGAYREDLEQVVEGLRQAIAYAGDLSRSISEDVVTRGREVAGGGVGAASPTRAAKAGKVAKG